jgi:hypothetical protein
VDDSLPFWSFLLYSKTRALLARFIHFPSVMTGDFITNRYCGGSAVVMSRFCVFWPILSDAHGRFCIIWPYFHHPTQNIFLVTTQTACCQPTKAHQPRIVVEFR